MNEEGKQKIKRHRKKRSGKLKPTGDTALVNEDTAAGVHNQKLQTTEQFEIIPRKRKRKHRSEAVGKTDSIKFCSVSEEAVHNQEESTQPPIKQKKRRPKKSNKMNAQSDSVHTNSNYPSESSAPGNISCNWKKLSQILGSNKPSSVDNIKGDHKILEKLFPSKPGTEGTNNRKSSVENEIWFDGVDKELIEPSVAKSGEAGSSRKENRLVKKGSFSGLTSVVAMDCEMVGTGENGEDSILARVSIVNLMGNSIYDKYVKPTDVVVDYRTAVSGIRPSDLENAEDFKVVQKEVSDILDKRILVGHAVYNDLKVLFLTHPRKKIRDTSAYKPFRRYAKGNTPSLKSLAEKVLGVKVQQGEHNSVQDAQAAMRLYTMHKIDWENSLKKHKSRKNATAKSSPTVKKVTSSHTRIKLSQLKI